MAGIAVFGVYSFTWAKSRLTDRHRAERERTLKEDLCAGFQIHNVDAMWLSECGEVEEGLGQDFHVLLLDICGRDFSVICQSHYACILRISSIDFAKGPSLTEPLSRLPDHEYRK